MRVFMDGIVFENQSRGGIARLYYEIMPRLCDLDNELFVTLLISGKSRHDLPAHTRISYRFFPPLQRVFLPGRLFWALQQEARTFVQQQWLSSQTSGIWHSTYYTLPRQWNGSIVVTVLDMLHERYENLFNRRVDDQFRIRKQDCISVADAVICISENTRQDLLQRFRIDETKIKVIPLACSPVFRRTREALPVGVPTDKPFLLYVGSRHHYKNFSLLLDAYTLWHRRRETSLVVVGPEWSPLEIRILKDRGVAQSVHLLSTVDDKYLCQLYNRAEVFIYPSLYEGFGIPLLEAMACGCPIVASRIPSTIEVAGDCAIYFESTEIDDLLNAFDIALAEGRYSARVQVGLKRVKHFSWDKTAEETLEVYRTLSRPCFPSGGRGG